MLEVQNLTKSYGEGDTLVNAVDNVSLRLNKGEVIFIMGPSGSGKTTLLTMLGLLLRPSSGKILVENQQVTDMTPNQLAKLRLNKLGFVFQNFQLLSSLTVLENVELVLNLAAKKGPKARERAEKILSQLGLQKRLKYLPDKLSGGEKQRVAIARALVNDPSIILADEPTANLDSRNGQLVGELLKQLVKESGKCLVVVTHDNRLTSFADRILIIEDGKLKTEN